MKYLILVLIISGCRISADNYPKDEPQSKLNCSEFISSFSQVESFERLNPLINQLNSLPKKDLKKDSFQFDLVHLSSKAYLSFEASQIIRPSKAFECKDKSCWLITFSTSELGGSSALFFLGHFDCTTKKINDVVFIKGTSKEKELNAKPIFMINPKKIIIANQNLDSSIYLVNPAEKTGVIKKIR